MVSPKCFTWMAVWTVGLLTVGANGSMVITKSESPPSGTDVLLAFDTSDASDLNFWNANKFTTSDGVYTVPEPTLFLVVLLMVLTVTNRRAASFILPLLVQSDPKQVNRRS